MLEDQKAKLQKAETNDLMLTKYANKKNEIVKKVVVHIPMFLLPQAHSYQQNLFLLLLAV